MMALVRQITADDDSSDTGSSDDTEDEEVEGMPALLIEDEVSLSSDDDEDFGNSSTDDDDGLEGMPPLLFEDEDDSSSFDEDEDSDIDSIESDDDGFFDDEPTNIPSAGDLCGMVTPIVDDTAMSHSRLGHQGRHSDLQEMIKNGILPPTTPSTERCDPCAKGKFKRFFRGSLTKDSKPGKIHADLVGRTKPRSLEGYEYFLTIIDEATRYAKTIPLNRKPDASPALLRFMTWFERQTGIKLRVLHTDDGSKYSKARKQFEEIGNKVTTATAYTPSSNGLVERTQGVLLSHARSCLNEAKLPLTYRPHALEHVTQGRNVLVHSATGRPPCTALFGHSAEYVKHMRPFGCRVLVEPVKKKLRKFESRLIEGVCLGHVDGGIYKVLTQAGTIKTKHVRFIESIFPGTALLNKQGSITVNQGGTSTLQVDCHSSDDEEYSTPVVSIGEQPGVPMLGGGRYPADQR